jgi:hypothetical protein
MRTAIITIAALLASISTGDSIAAAAVANAPQEVVKNYGNGLVVALKCGGAPLEMQSKPCRIEIKMRRKNFRIVLNPTTTYGYTQIHQDFIVFGSVEHEDISIRLPVSCGNWQNDETPPTDMLDCFLYFKRTHDGFGLKCLEKIGVISGENIFQCIKPDDIEAPKPYP